MQNPRNDRRELHLMLVGAFVGVLICLTPVVLLFRVPTDFLNRWGNILGAILGAALGTAGAAAVAAFAVKWDHERQDTKNEKDLKEKRRSVALAIMLDLAAGLLPLIRARSTGSSKPREGAFFRTNNFYLITQSSSLFPGYVEQLNQRVVKSMHDLVMTADSSGNLKFGPNDISANVLAGSLAAYGINLFSLLSKYAYSDHQFRVESFNRTNETLSALAKDIQHYMASMKEVENLQD